MGNSVAAKILMVSACAGILAGCSNPESPTDESSVTTPPADASVVTRPVAPPRMMDSSLLYGIPASLDRSRAVLDILPVKKPASMAGFNPSLFPAKSPASRSGWLASTSTRAGCSPLVATLERDAREFKLGGKCSVESGAWVDPYTGKRVTDHKEMTASYPVPLEEVWRSGGNAWTAQQRAIFASSPVSLTSTTTKTATKIAGQGASSWGPDWSQAQCVYAIRYITIKDQFGLSLTSQQERDHLSLMLGACGNL